jgi:DNA-binding XRE family transcriptional regulator
MSHCGNRMGRPRKTDEENAFNARLGMLISETRKAKGMMARDLADALGVTHSAIYNWEAGENAISLCMLRKICVVLCLPLDHLVQASTYRCKPSKCCAECLKNS